MLREQTSSMKCSQTWAKTSTGEAKEPVENGRRQCVGFGPYFSYWVTFVQIVIFIVSVAVYGIAPIGVSTTKVSKNVKMPNLAIQTETYIERENLWIGPRQADLIHLGAKYSPCMRVDENLNEALNNDRKRESNSACCIRNDGSGCVQTSKDSCSNILSTWEKWTESVPGPDNRTSGTVCGQDPRFCSNPSSTPPFEWKDKITDWPICKDTARPNQSIASRKDRHMNCDILGRPCCFGIQGECIITTPEHCELQRGFFHSDAYLCSQVDCFEEICGMIPFADSTHPDQFYRLWTSLFLHGGLVHLVISIMFQMYIMRDLEKLMGAIRTCIIYIGSGVAGNLASCTFIPYQVEVGPSGAQFGIAACMVVEVIQSYQMYRRPWRPVLITVAPLLCFFILGLLPWFDNWAHIFGFFFGFLLAFAVMPYVTFGKFDRHRKFISIIVSLGLAIGLFTILVLVFYVAPLTECDWCIYLNCIPFTADFCENMAVDLNKKSNYSTRI
ncbi:rhomboid-like protein [Plakobranchus ocellatus]|uniref:Rhomboid-like protein n=1 Tax=Plakobranchus ocellatus TaxID=259542 RepID=A0AAV4CIT7_9GAST|nr:rhomboid-like protein [Plakobranchus ocellatus]